jgi:diguanylate cyclase (GGDEF)-like protein/PAS domain S-box-containing protein
MHAIIGPFVKLMHEIRSEYAFAPEHNPGLERHIFRLSCLTISLLAFLVLIPANLLQDISYLASVPIALCGGVAFALYRAAQRGRHNVNTMLVMILATLNATWFLNGGTDGSVPYFIFPICMYPLILYHGWKRYLILTGIVANGCILIALSYRYPWIVTPYRSGFDRTTDLMVGMITCSLFIILAAWVVLTTYMREQERLKVLNLKLEQEIEGRIRTEDELLRSNKDLAATKEKFRTVAEYTENWEFWLGTDGRFIYTSPSSLWITGYDAKTFYDDPGLMERIVHPEDRELFARHSQVAGCESGTRNLSFRIIHADGSTRWIEHICRPITDANGVFKGIRGSNRDITGRKETEEELRRSEERYRRIVDTANEGIWVIGPDTETILVNTRMAEMIGYSRSEMIGRPYTDFMFQEDLTDHLKQLDNRRRGISEAYERRFCRKDGQTVWTHASATPLFDDEQHFIGSFGMFTDITERRKAEGRLAELNKCFLHFGADSDRNIDRLVTLCGELLGSACAVYSRLEREELLPVSTWNTPADFSKEPHSAGQLCYEVFHGVKNQVIVIENLPQSEYMNTDPKVSRYGIRTYTGKTVSYGGTECGLLCAVYVDDKTPGEEDKKLLGIVTSAIGVEEERKKALAAMKENEATLRSITGSARDAIIMIDGEGRTSFWNESASQIFGWNEAEALGSDLHAMILPGRYQEAFGEWITRLAATGTGNAVGETFELQAMRKDGSEVPVEVSLSAARIKGQWNAVGIIRDITERKRAEAEIEHMAYHDALTGLPNRLLLDDRLSQAIAHAGRLENMVGVLFFDLDNFKSINDSLGHPIGDLLLKKVVERLGQRLRKSDTIARMGGDEFIVVLSDIQAPEDAAHAARIFLDAFSEPFQLDGQEIYTSASMGISLYPIDGANTATLLKNADIAMYQSKKHGRNSFQFFTEEINRRAEERLLLENELRHAINRGEFILHYQPWIDLATGTIGGVEALIRWVHPERGIISPTRFIPIAEETGLIIPIGEWVMRTACRFLEEIHRKGLGWFTMSVNVSGVQLRNPNLIGLLGLLLADAVFDPSRLELELTESSVMENLEESRRYMDALKMIGVRLALDDFGTGYSSLSYLKRFPLDRLKIDRTFVRDCPENPDDVAIARAVIALARSLNLQVTAEGVENLEQADFFSRENCDAIQGHLICEPLPGNELLRILCD